MLSHVWFIARKEVHYLLRMRETLLWLLVMPPLFMFFVGSVTRNFGGRNPGQDPLALVTSNGDGFLAEQLSHRLEENGFRVEHPATPAALAGYSRQVRLPEDFTGRVLAGQPVLVKFTRPDDDLLRQWDQLRVTRATYTVLADLIACLRAGELPGPESFARLQHQPRTLTLDVHPVGRPTQIPSGFEQAVPGLLVMFTLLVMLTSGAVSLIAEREQGLLKRLASTPLSPVEVYAGKWAGRLVLGFIQILFAVLSAQWLFQMDWGPDWPMIFVVLLAWAAVCASVGMGLGTLARTDGQAIGLGVLATNVLAALGGCWWPIEISPPWMQTLANALPTGWTMNALHQLISFRAGAASAWPWLAGLLGTALFCGVLGARRFRLE